eukprot:6586095-Alexandrium_andersonii.AAC.1
MSASLVGSEMCIRDRRSLGMCSWSTHASGKRGKLGECPPAASLHCVTPVSYTHLTLPTICSV